MITIVPHNESSTKHMIGINIKANFEVIHHTLKDMVSGDQVSLLLHIRLQWCYAHQVQTTSKKGWEPKELTLRQ